MTGISGILRGRKLPPYRETVAIALALAMVSINLEVAADGADAAAQPVVQVEPSTGVGSGSVVVTGTGFTPGVAVTVLNQTTQTTVCSTTAASDGTISCTGVAGATPGTVSAIGVGASTASYSAVGSGEIATIAGGGGGGAGDGGPATMASLTAVRGIAVDSLGDVYFSDTNAGAVREVHAATGIVTAVAGVTGSPGYGGDGGPATSAQLFEPTGLVLDDHNDLYIADSQNYRVREVNLTTGVITTVAGDGADGYSGDGGPATAAELNYPDSVAVDGSGNLFISDQQNRQVREVSAGTGEISTVLAGGGGLAVDTSGHLFVAGGSLRQVDLATNAVTTIPGVSSVDAVAADQHGNVFVSGQLTYVVQRVHLATGAVTTIAGTGVEGFSGDGGPATEADLYQPMAVAVDTSDNVYVGSLYDKRVREVVAGPALSITSAPVSGPVSAQATMGPITVAEEDAFGNPVAAPSAGTTVALASSSATGFFAAAAGGAATTGVTIPAGSSSTTFFYGDSAFGSPWLTASASGYGTGAQQANVSGPPTAPLNLEATGGSAQATVAWIQPSSDGGSPITSYTVTASPGGATCSSIPSIGQCTVSGLTDGTTYTFTATATNAVGTSPPSAPSNAVVPEGVPGAPGSVAVVAGNDSGIVSFQPPASDGGSAITSYTATATDLSNAAKGGQTATGPTSPLTVTGLVVGDRYTFTVAATNAVGQGPASAPSNALTAGGVPGSLTLQSAVAGDGEVLLSWAGPTSSGGSAVTGYDIFVGTSPNGESSTPIPGSPVDGSPTLVTGLTDGQRYYFKVTAVNAVGGSVLSNEVSATPSRIAFSLKPGAATNIAEGADGSVWVVGTNPVPGGYGIYRWTGSGWANVPGGAVDVAVGPDGNAFVVNSAHQIFAWTGSGWALGPGAARDIAIGADGSLWVVGTNPVPGGYGIYRWTDSGWANVPGGAVTIAVGPDGTPFVVNSAHQIFAWTGSGWALGPGAARDIAIGADGSLWVVGTNPVPGGYGIYRRTDSGWANVPGGAVDIALGPVGRPWVVNSSDRIYAG